MAVNLKKGQRIDLRKEDGGDLKNVMVGLGWDPVQQKRIFFRPADIDCDATVFLLRGGKLKKDKDIVSFFNLKHNSGAVVHMGDNLTGEGEGDDEEIRIDLANLPDDIDKVVIVVNIYQAKSRKQHFGMIANAFVRIVDMDNGKELMRYDLSGADYADKTAMIFGEVYRHNGKWKFAAIGEGTADNSIQELSLRYS